MTRLNATLLAILFCSVLVPGPAFAETVDQKLQRAVSQFVVEDSALTKGNEAFDRGDYAGAIRAWKPLAIKGNGPALVHMGEMYDRGMGVPQDDKEAVRYFRRAAELGDAFGQANLGAMYEHGRGVVQDYREAARLYQLSADKENSLAQSNLGYLYDSGNGVAQDNAKAIQLYRLAGEQGQAGAMNNLGVLYATGRGLRPNKLLAFALWNLSSIRDGNPSNGASGNKAKIAQFMSQAEIDLGVRVSSQLAESNRFSSTLDQFAR